MVDTVKILGALLGNGAVSKGSAGNVLGNVLGAALGGNQQSSSGGLGDLLGGLLGGGQQQQQRQSGGGLGDLVGSVLAAAISSDSNNQVVVQQTYSVVCLAAVSRNLAI